MLIQNISRQQLDMTSTFKHPGRNEISQSSEGNADTPAALTCSPQTDLRSTPSHSSAHTGTTNCADTGSRTTAIEQCVQHELSRYFDMLDGEEPAHLYRMVMRQAENAVIRKVMAECRGNQTRASLWLGISRGNLRTKLANMEG